MNVYIMLGRRLISKSIAVTPFPLEFPRLRKAGQ